MTKPRSVYGAEPAALIGSHLTYALAAVQTDEEVADACIFRHKQHGDETGVDPRRSLRMRTRHGLFRDSNGDTRYPFLLSSTAKIICPQELPHHGSCFHLRHCRCNFRLLSCFTFILKLCPSSGRFGSCFIGIS
jgi:hypothetical protein